MCWEPPIGCRTSSPPTYPAGRSWNGRSDGGCRRSRTSTSSTRSSTEPTYDAALGRVTGVLLDSDEIVPADLVVDAAGRGTRLPAWLEKWGYERPREETVDVGIAYASHQFHVPEGLLAEKVVVAGASREQPLGIGALFYEDGNWNVTTFGVGKVEPPQNVAQMLDLVDEILPAHFSSALRQGAPLGEMAFHKYPTSRWRRYDKLARFPGGIFPFGDAVVSFNPTFGQGMTMTAIQAGNLRAVIESGNPDIAARLAKATAKTTYPVWTMTAIGDLTLHNATTTGAVPRWYKPVGGSVRPVPRRRRDGSRTGRMVFAQVQPSRQSLHGAVRTPRRPHHPAQHEAVAGREAFEHLLSA